ncbi:MAG: tetratricopeptide repeat protein, partial [Gemmatimonadaceae bacterium]
IGEEMIKTDTAAADTNFFTRIVAAYSADSNYAKGAEWASRATAKFPQNANLWMLSAQLARQAGQAPQALASVGKALAINPKAERANLMVAQIYMEMNQPDSVVAALQRAEASGDDKTLIGGMALSLGNRMRTAFTQSKKTEDGQEALKVLAYSDKVNPSDNAKFLQGIINLTMGQQLLTEASAEKSCDKAKLANDAFTNAQIQIPAGGKAFPDQAKAALEGLMQLIPYGDRATKALCK